ncbi:MAG TPA: hypothetical protein VKT78_04885 [Fimbriimonadaceae bacterium]|nr:hypothetical protein [Fimbriimonadaceae bacterium]
MAPNSSATQLGSAGERKQNLWRLSTAAPLLNALAGTSAPDR